MHHQDPSELIRQGKHLFDQASYQVALGCFTQAAELARRDSQNSNELNALVWIPICWGNQGEHNKAAEAAYHLLARAKQLDSKWHQMEAGLRLSIALANIDLPTRWPEIRPVLLEGLQVARQLGDDHAIVYHLEKLGEYSHEVGEDEPAYAWLQDALNAVSPGMQSENFFRFKIYESLSNWAKARGERAEALRYAEMMLGATRADHNPSFLSAAQIQLARIQRWRGEHSEALILVDAALATSRRLNLEFDIVECLVLKTMLFTDLGLIERAQGVYNELRATEWQNPDCYKDIGPVAYKQMRDLSGAEQAFRRFLEGRPTHPDGHSKLALVLFDQEQVSEAVRAWRAALTYRERHPDALAGLALGLWMLGEREEAVAIFSQAVSLRPQVVEPAYLDEDLGWSTQAVEAIRPLIDAFRGTLLLHK